MLTVVSDVFIVTGSLIFALAALGLLRLPDVFTRISAIGTAAGVGVACLVLGVVLQDPSPANLVKGLGAILLQGTTSVIGAIAIARAAVLRRQHFAPGTDTQTVEHLGALAVPPDEGQAHREGRGL